MRFIDRIVIHCSYSEWGNLEEITRWHTAPPPLGQGWPAIGYHYLILNRFTSLNQVNQQQTLCSTTDGEIVKGRPVSHVGSHAKGYNDFSIGICYVGVTPSVAQYNALLYMCKSLMKKFPLIKIDKIVGHYEVNNEGKTCPNFCAETFRKVLEYQITNI